MDDQNGTGALTQDQVDALYLLYGIMLAAGILIIEAMICLGLVPPHELG